MESLSEAREEDGSVQRKDDNYDVFPDSFFFFVRCEGNSSEQAKLSLHLRSTIYIRD